MPSKVQEESGENTAFWLEYDFPYAKNLLSAGGRVEGSEAEGRFCERICHANGDSGVIKPVLKRKPRGSPL